MSRVFRGFSAFAKLALLFLLIGVQVATHEMGHLVAHRCSGHGVLAASFGIGPVLLVWRGPETDYELRLLPVIASVTPSSAFNIDTLDAGDVEFARLERPARYSAVTDESRRPENSSRLVQVLCMLAGPVIHVPWFLGAWWLYRRCPGSPSAGFLVQCSGRFRAMLAQRRADSETAAAALFGPFVLIYRFAFAGSSVRAGLLFGLSAASALLFVINLLPMGGTDGNTAMQIALFGEEDRRSFWGTVYYFGSHAFWSAAFLILLLYVLLSHRPPHTAD